MENEAALNKISTEKVNEFACAKFDKEKLRYSDGKIAGQVDDAYATKEIVIEEG